MTARQTTNNAGTLRLLPGLSIDIDVDAVGLGALLFTFNIPGSMRMFVNLTVRLFGFTVISGHVAIV